MCFVAFVLSLVLQSIFSESLSPDCRTFLIHVPNNFDCLVDVVKALDHLMNV